MATCGLYDECGAIVYRAKTHDCMIYKQRFDTSAEVIPDLKVTYFQKQPVGQWSDSSMESESEDVSSEKSEKSKSRRRHKSRGRSSAGSGSASSYGGEGGSSSIQGRSNEDN